MARRLRSPKLENRTSRLDRLAVRKKPYSAPIAPGVVLLYRRNRGAGTWGVRLTEGGKDQTHRLGIADDYADADGRDVLDYLQAHDAARAKAKEYEGTAEPITISKALDQYESTLKDRGGDIGNVVRARGHLSAEMLDRTVSSLNAGELKRWRDRLTKDMRPASANRTATCLKAALNLAADHDERITHRPWQIGLKAIPDAERSRNAVLILDDATVRAIVNEAYRPGPIDESDPEARAAAEQAERERAEKFGTLIEVLAVTGSRVSQAARLLPQDVQSNRGSPRLMMPTSKKGKGVKKITRRPVPIPAALAITLRKLATKAGANALLLTRTNDEPWKKSDHSRPFRNVIARLRKRALADAREAGANEGAAAKAASVYDGVTVYALRHSSIVRQLLAGTPIRIVAVNHDTSVAMIEKHYSDFIGDHSDPLARKALIDFSAPPTDNVVTLHAGGTQ